MPDFRDDLPHILVSGLNSSEPYKSPKSGPRKRFPNLDRQNHASLLRSQMNIIASEIQRIKDGTRLSDPISDGAVLEFESFEGFELSLQSLDLKTKGIEILNVRIIGNKTYASVYVPESQMGHFLKILAEYSASISPDSNPKNRALVESIASIRLALIKSLWTDTDDSFPAEGEAIWWEVWLRATADALPRFSLFIRSRGMIVGQRSLNFLDRSVVLAYGTIQQISQAIQCLNIVAELRKAKELVSDFMRLPKGEDADWSQSLLEILDTPGEGAPRVSVLDTGINREHPLLVGILDEGDIHSCDPAWGTHDHEGHGTGMGGVAAYGDLAESLVATRRLHIPAKLESVKILPPRGSNHPELWGELTLESVGRVEVTNPGVPRVFLMAVTSEDFRDAGRPSAWSAAVDQACYGERSRIKRLFIVSAGNIETSEHISYPDSNLLRGIHDPAQAWNALTVGAYTEKTQINDDGCQHWTPIAEVGGLSPSSTTSAIWERSRWPIKPEIVMEGGNTAKEPGTNFVSSMDSLSLLTTNADFRTRNFTVFGDTSAAAALAANFEAKILARYSDFWPETVRGLAVHSAEWTPAMKVRFPAGNRTQMETRLRACGYGVPDLRRAIYSASNALTLVVQGELQPFEGGKMKEMHLHNLPWPSDVLESLGEVDVELRVTLSYFIEPNPARRGWTSKHRYHSHGLRFDVITPEESLDQFKKRINRAQWDEETGSASVSSNSDAAHWEFGPGIRSKGSLHTDRWKGSAVQLSRRNTIAIFPVTGWWKDKYTDDYSARKARYSLLVTISSPRLDVDIYTPVEALVTVAGEVSVSG